MLSTGARLQASGGSDSRTTLTDGNLVATRGTADHATIYVLDFHPHVLLTTRGSPPSIGSNHQAISAHRGLFWLGGLPCSLAPLGHVPLWQHADTARLLFYSCTSIAFWSSSWSRSARDELPARPSSSMMTRNLWVKLRHGTFNCGKIALN
eukprot:2455739-Prymnesium_polylepis.2